MKRVLVIGAGGAGKSTFSQGLGTALGLEVLHLDKHYWNAGWIEPPKDVWLATVDALLAKEAWVMDGNYSGTLARRIEACDTLIFLDLPRLQCAWRILKRVLMYGGRGTRPDMADGCPERMNLDFLAWVWNYHRRSRPKVLALMQQCREAKRVIHLRSQREVDSFLRTLTVQAPV
jgi:adenylate kinase family enzyme